MNELIMLIWTFNDECGYRAIDFRRVWDEEDDLYWMIWYGYCGQEGEGRMAYHATTEEARAIVDTIIKMHQLFEMKMAA